MPGSHSVFESISIFRGHLIFNIAQNPVMDETLRVAWEDTNEPDECKIV